MKDMARSRVAKLLWKKPEFRKKMQLRNKRQWENKKFRKLMSNGASRWFTKLWKSKKHRERMSKNLSRRNRRNWKDPKYRQRMTKVLRHAIKDAWKDPEFSKRVLSSRVHPSRPQLWLFYSLCRKGFHPKLECQAGRYSIDIAILHFRLAIEVDGSYWHRNPKREARKNRFLKKLGWKVIHVNSSLVKEFDIQKVL